MSSPIDWAVLRAPFTGSAVKWRVQASGIKANGEPWARAVIYVNAAAIRERLDTVLTPAGWRVEYAEFLAQAASGTVAPGVLAGIGIRVEGEWLTKWDGAQQTDEQAFKGGLSSAFKRAAAVWGLGLSGIQLVSARWEKDGEHTQPMTVKDKKTKQERPGFWAIPKAPRAAPPPAPTTRPAEGAARSAPNGDGGRSARPRKPVPVVTPGEPSRPPGCPTCHGPMWDRRRNKFDAKAPDFVCRDRNCDGVYWLGDLDEHWMPRKDGPPSRAEYAEMPAALRARTDDPF